MWFCSLVKIGFLLLPLDRLRLLDPFPQPEITDASGRGNGCAIYMNIWGLGFDREGAGRKLIGMRSIG